MSKGDSSILSVLMILVVVLLVTVGVLADSFLRQKNTAIENNCAQYNATTGEFEWKVK